MADTNLYNTLLAGGQFVGQHAAIAKVSNVNSGGTVAINGTWTILPEEEPYKGKRVLASNDVNPRSGAKRTIRTLIGFDYTSLFTQRDAVTHELDLSFAGQECVLISLGHYFGRLTTPKRGWLFVFGTVVPHDADVDSVDGKIPFMFQGQPNGQAIVLNSSTTASGKVEHPDLALLTPSADITIPAYNGGALTGIYKIVDL